MATEIRGKANCPECGEQQDVKHDGRKFFITCTACKTMTSYQSKIAKARIENKMIPLDIKPVAPEIIPGLPPNTEVIKHTMTAA